MSLITFYRDYRLDESSVKFVMGTVGIYFIFLYDLNISYPFRTSRLIYIGMSEAQQNSIGKRLRAHLSGQSGNEGIKNYASRHHVRFTFHSLEVLQHLGTRDLFELEAFFLSNFLSNFGCYPICNNQSGIAVEAPSMKEPSDVDWSYFL